MPGLDDETGEPLTRRKDDNKETLTKRLEAFHAQARVPTPSHALQPPKTRSRPPSRPQTKPVVDYYSKQGLYSPLNADQKADTVKAAISAILSK